MTESIVIRPFERQDQDDVRRLILDGLAEHFPAFDPALNADLEDIVDTYVKKGASFLVAAAGQEIVGTGALIRETQNTARIVRVSVAKTHRRKGIARRLTSELLRLARDSHFAAVVVETNDDWHGALQLYRSCGFEETDRRCGEVHMMLRL